MNIKQGLKRKQKLLGLISEELKKVQTYNSIIAGNDRPYDVNEALNNYRNYTNELIKLKTAIHKANVPVFDNIFRLSELKSQIKSIRTISCESGKTTHPYKDIVTEKESIISIADKDTLIKNLEEQIEKLQEELDEFNYKTNI